MDLSTFQQYGLAGIFIAAAWKLYSDMRSDGLKRETLLMNSLKEQSETTIKIAATLEKIDARLCELERCDK